MGWDDQGNGNGKDSPPTSFVRLPDKAERPAPRANPGTPAPPPAWTPNGPPRSGPGAPPSTPEAPFGGYQSSGQTAMMRRQTDNTRFFAVLGVVGAVLALGGLAVWLAVHFLKKEPPPVEDKGKILDVPPKDVKPDFIDDDEEAPDPAANTGATSTTKSGTSTTKSGTGSKSGTSTTKSGTSTTKSGTGTKTGKTTTGRTPGNPHGGTTGR